MFPEEIQVEPKDKEMILAFCDKIQSILKKYPYKKCVNNWSTAFAKTYAAVEDLQSWALWLETKE